MTLAVSPLRFFKRGPRPPRVRLVLVPPQSKPHAQAHKHAFIHDITHPYTTPQALRRLEAGEPGPGRSARSSRPGHTRPTFQPRSTRPSASMATRRQASTSYNKDMANCTATSTKHAYTASTRKAAAAAAAPVPPLPADIEDEQKGELLAGTHYILDGPATGKLVVCVPGLGGPHWYFDELVPFLLQAEFRVLRYDLVGRGHSKPPPRTRRPSCFCNGVAREKDPYGMVGHVTQLRRLLVNLALVAKDDTDDVPASTSHPDRDDTDPGEIDDQLLSPLPLPAIHLMGHSMGGAIAVGYAERYPDDVASLTLLTPAGLMDKGVFKLLRSLPWFVQSIVQRCLRRNSLNAIRNDFLRHGTEIENRVVAQAQAMHARNPHAFPAIFRSILAFPLAGLEETIKNVSAARLPTLLVWAEYDRVVPFEPHYGRWKALLKTGQNVRYEVVKEAGHGFLLERPAVVGEMVVRFLKCPPSWVPPALINELSNHSSTITI